MKVTPLVIIAAITIHPVESAPVPLLINPGGSFDVSYQLSTGPSTSATLQITGNLTGDVEMSDGVISRFRFLGGNVAYSDTTSDIIVSTFPVTAKVKILTRSIVSSTTSNSSAGAINTTTGVISNSGHRLIQNRGTVTTRYMVGSAVIQEDIRNLAQEPDSNAFVGVTTVTSSLLQDLNYKARYRIDFSHTRNETRTQPAEVVGGTLNTTEEGGFSAAGEITVPGQAFASWALANRNQRPITLEDRHTATGQPLVLLYAFDSADGPWSPPVSFDTVYGTIRLDLPPAGLRAPVRLEFSTSLANGQWLPLTKNGGAPSVFNMGESGPVTMALPTGGAGFIRLSLAD